MYNVSFGVVLLSCGKGKRMNTDIPKQYIDIAGRPVLYYSLKQFEENSLVKDIILVVSPEDIDMVRDNIVNKYGITKVRRIVAGGAERFNSVYNGLTAMDSNDYVMIHDGARPCISRELIERLQEAVIEAKACVPAVSSKDTIKIADEYGYVRSTPKRSDVWNVQTPQTFEYEGIRSAFDKYMKSQDVIVTDDSMVWEIYNNKPVKIVIGDYTNIKITTPDDLYMAEHYIDLCK